MNQPLFYTYSANPGTFKHRDSIPFTIYAVGGGRLRCTFTNLPVEAVQARPNDALMVYLHEGGCVQLKGNGCARAVVVDGSIEWTPQPNSPRASQAGFASFHD